MHEGVVAAPTHRTRNVAGAVFPYVASFEALGAHTSGLDHVPTAGRISGLECFALLDCVEVHVFTEPTTPIPVDRFFRYMRVFFLRRVSSQQRGKPDTRCRRRETASACGGAPAT